MHDLRVNAHPNRRASARGGAVGRTSNGRKPNQALSLAEFSEHAVPRMLEGLPVEDLPQTSSNVSGRRHAAPGRAAMHGVRVVAVRGDDVDRRR